MFRIKQSFDEAVQNKDIYWNEEPYCSLLRKNLMTCKCQLEILPNSDFDFDVSVYFFSL